MIGADLLRRARWTLAAAIVVAAIAMVALSRSSYGERRSSQYLVMMVFQLAWIGVPALLAIDLARGLLQAAVAAVRGNVRSAIAVVVLTAVADGALFALALAAAFAVLEWRVG